MHTDSYSSADQNMDFNAQYKADVRIGHGYAHSKIILMGEHSVVYDYPAIAFPFQAADVQVKIKPLFKGSTILNSDYYRGKLTSAPEEFNNIKAVVNATIESFNFPNQPLEITVNSTIPAERGMGSSAAVAVAIVRGLCDLYEQEIPDQQLYFLANQAEVIAHESTSGLDTLVASTISPVIYRKSQKPHPFEIDIEAYLVVADSGEVGQTKLAVSKVRQLKDKKSAFVTKTMKAIGDFVQRAYQAIQDKQVEELGRLMTYNHYYLNQLGVSNTTLDQIVNAAWMAGALGAKLTGGGLGGCVIALAKDADDARYIAEAMEAMGAQTTWTVNLSKSNS